MKRILIYSHDTYGLGNIRRMLEIATHFVESDPEVSVLILSGSPMLHAFRISQRIDYVKLPCLTRKSRNAYASKYLDIGYDEAIRLRSNLILGTVLDFKPDLLLVDKKPLGIGRELESTLELLEGNTARPTTVLLLRDILDRPDVTIRIWQRKRYHETIARHYDRVCVVGEPEIFDIRTEYRFPPSSAGRVEYCGYIGRKPGNTSPAEVRRGLQIGDEPLVLVTAGGGEDGYHLLSTYVRGLARLPFHQVPRSLLICGPEMSKTHRQSLLTSARGCPTLTVKTFSDDMMSDMSASDIVVSMGGYNTICEILTLKKQAIVVPRVSPVQEQWIRCRRMATRGLLTALHPDDLTPERLMGVLRDKLASLNVRSTGLYQLRLDGLSRLSNCVSELLKDRLPNSWAPPLVREGQETRT